MSPRATPAPQRCNSTQRTPDPFRQPPGHEPLSPNIVSGIQRTPPIAHTRQPPTSATKVPPPYPADQRQACEPKAEFRECDRRNGRPAATILGRCRCGCRRALSHCLFCELWRPKPTACPVPPEPLLATSSPTPLQSQKCPTSSLECELPFPLLLCRLDLSGRSPPAAPCVLFPPQPPARCRYEQAHMPITRRSSRMASGSRGSDPGHGGLEPPDGCILRGRLFPQHPSPLTPHPHRRLPRLLSLAYCESPVARRPQLRATTFTSPAQDGKAPILS